MHFRRSSPLLRVGACCRLRRPGASLLRAPGTAAARTLAATSSSAAEESTTTRRIGALFFSGLCGVTGCLTAWQLSRYDWKLRLIDEREKSLRDAPVPLRSLVPELADGCSEDAEFRRVACEGVFDHEKQVLVGPRSAPAGSGAGGNAPAGAPMPSGWDVLTPLRCADGTSILVNRGWVSRDDVGSIGKPTGLMQVSGVLKRGEARNKYAHNDLATRRFVWLDLPTIASETGTAPVVVVATAAPEPSPRGGAGGTAAADTPPARWPRHRPLESFLDFHVKPSTHLVYATTWASLSVAGAVITFKRFVR